MILPGPRRLGMAGGSRRGGYRGWAWGADRAAPQAGRGLVHQASRQRPRPMLMSCIPVGLGLDPVAAGV